MKTKTSKGFEIKSKTATEIDLYIYDEIEEYWGIGAREVAEGLAQYKDAKTINVHINSPGGSVFEGLAIYNTLRQHKATVKVSIEGFAASIASIIAMAGDENTMADNAFIMIHDPWISTSGTADDLREQADMMDKVRDSLVSTYVKRSGLDEDTVSEMMHAETWLNAEEALERGFIDSITDGMQLAACFDLKRFSNAPDAVKATLEKKDRPNTDSVREKLARMNQHLKRRGL